MRGSRTVLRGAGGEVPPVYSPLSLDNQRLAILETKVDNIDTRLDRIENRLDSMEAKFEAKFNAIDNKFAAIDNKFLAMDNKFESKFSELNKKIDANFKWTIGLWIGIVVLIVKAFMH